MVRIVVTSLVIVTIAVFFSPSLADDLDDRQEVEKCLTLLINHGCNGRLNKADCETLIDSSKTYFVTKFKHDECRNRQGIVMLGTIQIPCSYKTSDAPSNIKHVTYKQLYWLDMVFKYESPEDPNKIVAFIPTCSAPGFYERTFPKDYWMVSTYKASKEAGSIARNICLLEKHCVSFPKNSKKRSACREWVNEAKMYYVFTYGPRGGQTESWNHLPLPCLSSFPTKIEWTTLALNDDHRQTIVMALENFDQFIADPESYMFRMMNLVGARQVLHGW